MTSIKKIILTFGLSFFTIVPTVAFDNKKIAKSLRFVGAVAEAIHVVSATIGIFAVGPAVVLGKWKGKKPVEMEWDEYKKLYPHEAAQAAFADKIMPYFLGLHVIVFITLIATQKLAHYIDPKTEETSISCCTSSC